MKYSLNTLYFVILLSCFFVYSSRVDAQLAGTSQSDINIQMVPQNPGPNEPVSVTLSSYSTNINSATITWSVNGKVIKKGVGEKTFEFTSGDTNTTTTLNIIVRTIDGDVIQNTLKIKPSSVDLLWESQSFVPPFYRGKSLFSHQNSITFIAVPHITSGSGVEIGAQNLLYTWKINGVVKENESGYGKNTYNLVGSLISRPFKTEVSVSSPTSGASGYAMTIVNPIEPFVVFYKKDPLYGIEFQNALYGTELLDSKEITVIGMPFFFGTADPRSNLLYKWSINGAPIDGDTLQTTRVFRQTEGASGTSKISLSIEHASKILQVASASFNLMFGSSQ